MTVGLLSSLLCLIGYGSNPNKFDWKATESSPANFPMEIISGTLINHGERRIGLYIPAGKTIYYGWGQMVLSHLVGPDLKPLPDRLEITFFSFLENQHYRGTFNLPYDDILAMFREGENPEGDPTYDRIMVGVAPGGTVAVWLTGRYKTTEIFFGKADPVELDLLAFGQIISDRDAYVRAELEDTIGVELLSKINTAGIPFEKWSDLRKRYNWKPVFPRGNAPRDGAMTDFFNGELEHVVLPMSDEVASTKRAVPRKMQFTYRSPDGWSHFYIIHFDEEETTQAFEDLGSNQRPLHLEFYPARVLSDTQIKLSNEDESITLNKHFIEEF